MSTASTLPRDQDRPRRGPDVTLLAAAGLVGVAVLAAFWPNFADLQRKWESDPNYSHGYLVPFIAAWILWLRRDALAAAPVRPNWIGWPVLGALLAVRYALFERNEAWAESALIPPVIAALTLALG